jgi:hypothetical protein
MKTDHIHCLGYAAAAAEVRSSASQCVHSHRCTKCGRLCSAFERKRGAFERITALRTWNRGVRSHAEACQAERRYATVLE